MALILIALKKNFFSSCGYQEFVWELQEWKKKLVWKRRRRRWGERETNGQVTSRPPEHHHSGGHKWLCLIVQAESDTPDWNERQLLLKSLSSLLHDGVFTSCQETSDNKKAELATRRGGRPPSPLNFDLWRLVLACSNTESRMHTWCIDIKTWKMCWLDFIKKPLCLVIVRKLTDKCRKPWGVTFICCYANVSVCFPAESSLLFSFPHLHAKNKTAKV